MSIISTCSNWTADLFIFLLPEAGVRLGKRSLVSQSSLYYMLVDNPLTQNSVPCGLPAMGGRTRRGQSVNANGQSID